MRECPNEKDFDGYYSCPHSNPGLRASRQGRPTGPPQSIEIQPNHLYFIRGDIVPALKELAKKGRIDSLQPLYSKDFSSMDLVGIFVFLTPNPEQKSEVIIGLAAVKDNLSP
jgi:hypothetical protein